MMGTHNRNFARNRLDWFAVF